MKHVVRYLLDGDGAVPVFIEDGGHFPLNNELVGISVDDTERYLPITVHKLTREQLRDRLLSMGLKDEDDNDLTSEQCQTLADNFFDERGL